MTDTTVHTPAADAEPSDLIVVAEDLTKKYGDQVAVDGLTLSVPRGTIFGFIGPSGSGKTTTVRMLTGVQKPTSGTVTVFGTSPTSFTEREREQIGYMPQLSVLFPHLSIMENLRFVASIYGMSWGRRGRLNEALEFVELADDRRKRLRHASGGMQRRLALAAALINEPRLLFLDEPTTGIDPVLRRKFWDHFESLRDEGRTVFVTTQYVGEAAYCDRIGVLRRGRLLTVDTPEGLRRQAFGGEVIDLTVADRIDQELITDVTRLEYVLHAQRTRVDGRGMRITVQDADPAIPALQRWLSERNIAVEAVDRYLPPFDDVFVKLVEAEGPTELDSLTTAGEVTAPYRSEPPAAPPPVDAVQPPPEAEASAAQAPEADTPSTPKAPVSPPDDNAAAPSGRDERPVAPPAEKPASPRDPGGGSSASSGQDGRQ